MVPVSVSAGEFVCSVTESFNHFDTRGHDAMDCRMEFRKHVLPKLYKPGHTSEFKAKIQLQI